MVRASVRSSVGTVIDTRMATRDRRGTTVSIPPVAWLGGGAAGAADTLDPVSADPPVTVLIVGGGASGVLTAARIMDATGARPARVIVVEPNERLAAGVAYSTEDTEHLLNVRASGMSADPSDPDELVRWIAERGQPDRDTFVAAPRLPAVPARAPGPGRRPARPPAASRCATTA